MQEQDGGIEIVRIVIRRDENPHRSDESIDHDFAFDEAGFSLVLFRRAGDLRAAGAAWGEQGKNERKKKRSAMTTQGAWLLNHGPAGDHNDQVANTQEKRDASSALFRFHLQ